MLESVQCKLTSVGLTQACPNKHIVIPVHMSSDSSPPPYLPLSHLHMVHEDATDDLGLVSNEAVLANTRPFHRGLIRQLHTSTNQTV